MLKIKDILIVVFISGLTGGIVALPVILLRKDDLLPSLGESAIVGAVIGLSAWAAFFIFYNTLRYSYILSFSVIAVVIASGTFCGAYVLGLRYPPHFLIVIGLAELTGMLIAALGFRSYLSLNRKLKHVQKRYT